MAPVMKRRASTSFKGPLTRSLLQKINQNAGLQLNLTTVSMTTRSGRTLVAIRRKKAAKPKASPVQEKVENEPIRDLEEDIFEATTKLNIQENPAEDASKLNQQEYPVEDAPRLDIQEYPVQDTPSLDNRDDPKPITEEEAPWEFSFGENQYPYMHSPPSSPELDISLEFEDPPYLYKYTNIKKEIYECPEEKVLYEDFIY